MHQPGIVGDHQFGLSYQVGAFIDAEFTTCIINLYCICKRDLFSIISILLSSQQDQRVIHFSSKFLPFIDRPFLGAMRGSYNTGYVACMMRSRYIMLMRFLFF